MKPGRELDARIAEKVMGWKYVDTASGRRWAHPAMADEQNTVQGEAPHFSTDIEAAWVVLDAMKDYFGKYGFGEHGTDYEIFRVASTGPMIPETLAVGESAPHAICLAALKAVEANDQG